MSAAAEQRSEKRNVRAGLAQESTLNDEYKWFHLPCYQQNNLGFAHPIDFPDQARSGYTTCAVCRKPINEGP